VLPNASSGSIADPSVVFYLLYEKNPGLIHKLVENEIFCHELDICEFDLESCHKCSIWSFCGDDPSVVFSRLVCPVVSMFILESLKPEKQKFALSQ
jgi:hypothetical protein